MTLLPRETQDRKIKAILEAEVTIITVPKHHGIMADSRSPGDLVQWPLVPLPMKYKF